MFMAEMLYQKNKKPKL